ncbi:MAG: hypothetical protein JSW27_14255 [Phycisphaerales bacterium]|nr:MAG: hypothetical protein JSW27_14255 [Phycisphaerales bacterium]
MMGEIVSGYHLWLLLLTQGTACVALGLTGSYALKHHAARAHQVLLIALLASVLMPASYLGVRHFELGVLAAPVPIASEPEKLLDPQPVEAVVWTEVSATQTEPALATVETAAVPLPVPFVEHAQTARVPWRVILFVCWATATLVLTARLALRFVLGVFLLRNARPVEAPHTRRALDEACERINITGPVDIRANRKVCSPAIWCWGRTPTLLVQTDATEDTRPRDWVGVFCHELAHLKRRDHVTGLLAELLICLAPWHPLLWWSRKQLLRFSEEACDDWVLATGQIGVDYAESLLKLSPQRELAFVPTVVGKEKTMKARIYRIVKDQCSNPRIGRLWVLVVCVVTVCLAMGVAFAQRRPMERPRAERQERREQYERQRELMVAGRRNVLERLLDQLVAQTREIEAELRERGDDAGEDSHVLRAELEALREHIGLVERQLGRLEQRERPWPEPEEERVRRERMMEFDAPAEKLARHREELTERARRMELEYEELGEGRPEARERIEMELRALHDQIKAVAEEEANLDHDRARTEARRAEAERLRARETRERARAEAESMRNPNRQLRELQARARETELRLERIPDEDSIEAQELRASLDTTHEEMAQIEQELSRLRVAAARAEAERATRSATARAASRSRRAPAEAPRREGTLRQAHESLMAQIRLTEQKLKAAREEEDRPGAERLQGQLQRELSQLRVAAARAEAERAAQALSDAARGRSQVNPDMERQVEELRGKVDGMHEEMAQIRAMLQQLLQRRQVEKQEEEIQELKEY